MHNHRFSGGQTTMLPTSQQVAGRKIVQPYDQTLRFNRIVDQKPNNVSSIIYSIDAPAILKILEKDQLEDLFKTTLVCRPTPNGVGLWDTLFNSANRQSMAACIFLAQEDFSPIPQNRVVVGASYLDFGMAVSRVHLNEVKTGDRIGIGVHDMVKGFRYVLLYVVEDQCSIASNTVDGDGRASMLPAVNIRMEHALQIDYDGVATIVNMEEGNEYDKDAATPFVVHVAGAVYDISESYPWKPHFLPSPLGKFDKDELEIRLLEDQGDPEVGSFEEFEVQCRAEYRKAKENNSNTVRRRPKARTRAHQGPLPVVQVTRIADTYYIRFNDQGKAYSFNADELGTRTLVEKYFTNGDLTGVDLSNSRFAIKLSPEKFGDNAITRYLTVNY